MAESEGGSGTLPPPPPVERTDAGCESVIIFDPVISTGAVMRKAAALLAAAFAIAIAIGLAGAV